MNIYEFTILILWEILCFGLKMLFYILSCLGSIPRGLACYSISYHTLAVSTKACQWHAILYLIMPWQIRRGLACYSISYHTLAVSAEAWHAILYVITPWQYLPRLGMLFYICLCVFAEVGMLFYILGAQVEKQRHAGVLE